MSKTKNGKIELYRFIFCLCILFFHIEKYLIGEPSLTRIDIGFFPHGAMGVEFFFLVSGLFMAKSLSKKQKSGGQKLKNDREVADDWLAFMKHKYLRIFPQHTIAFVITFVCYVAAKQLGWLEIALLGVQNVSAFFLLQMTGLYFTPVNHIEWYLSCMLIGMAFIYPIARKHYYAVTHYFGPIVAILLLGYMLETTGAITGVRTWMGFCYKSLLRAIADMLLGMTAFELGNSLKRYGNSHRGLATLIELVALVCSLGFVLFTFSKEYEVIALIAIFVLVTVGFSGISIGSERFNNSFCYFLGDISLPIYLGQLSAIYLSTAFLGEYALGIQIGLTVILTFIIAFIVKYVGSILDKRFFSKLE